MTKQTLPRQGLSVYLLLCVSTLAHLTSGQHSLFLNIGFMALLCLVPFIPTRLFEGRGWLLTLNALTLGYLLFGIAQLVIMSVAPMELASSFLMVLMTNKLLGPKKPRDRMQLILLSLLQMVIASALSSGLTLGVFLIIYTLCLPTALTLLSMERDREAYGTHSAVETSPHVPENLGRKRLRLILILTGSAVMTGAIMFFIFIPRLGFGLFAPNHQGQSMTGFSGEVELGDFGRIRTNRRTVMRIRVDTNRYSRSQRMYWRGISLDRYEDGRWSKSFDQRTEIRPPRHGFLRLKRRAGKSTSQEIFLEPLDENVLFGLSQISSLSRCPRAKNPRTKVRYYKDVVGDLYYEAPHRQTLRYCLKSQQIKSHPADQALTLSTYQEHKTALSKTFQQTYFQIPPEITPTLNEVLGRIDFESDAVLDVVDTLETYLEKNYRYTLDRKSDTSVKPIADFLLKSPEGHCEYFATAMVLLLRKKGIGARLVNGFAGGRRNEIGEYIVVHQGNAHSWVEVFVPRKECQKDTDCTLVGHWLTIDPTPSQERIPESKSIVSDMIDALQLRWAEYVVRYDLRTQLAWMTAIFEWVMPASADNKAKTNQTAKRGVERPSPGSADWLYWVITAVGLLVIVGMVRRRRLSKPSRVDSKEATLIFEQVVQVFQQFGITKTDDQTARDWLEAVEKKGHSSAELDEFIRVYERCRFQPLAADLTKLRTLRSLIPLNEPSNQ